MMSMMKNRYLALLLWTLVSLAGAAPDVVAQEYTPVPVTISRSQVNMNGKTYYAHIVLERQTIYGITKAYGVTEEDLYAANPMLAQDGLKAGTVIYPCRCRAWSRGSGCRPCLPRRRDTSSGRWNI